MGAASTIHLLFLLLAFVSMSLTVYCLVAAVTSLDHSGFDRLWWSTLIFVVPIVGPTLWLVSERRKTSRESQTPHVGT